MKLSGFLIFISIVLLVYISVNYYIFRRGLQTIPENSILRGYYIGLFLFFSLSFWIGRILEKVWLSHVSDVFVWIGSFWLAFMLYFVLFALLFDFLRLLDYLFGIFPNFITANYVKAKFITGISVLIISIVTVLIGYLNFMSPQIREYEIKINKPSKWKALNVIVVSDIHMGTIVGRKQVEKIVGLINSVDPDLVLMPGDVIDEDLAPVLKQNTGAALNKIKSKLGVFAVTGNHEYIGGVEDAVKYLEEHNVKVIRDSYLVIDSSLVIAGREDSSIAQFAQLKRKSLAEVLEGADQNSPIFLMDHQPFNLNQSVENGVDLHLSGHTHHGQLWPLNYITSMVYELSWGYKQKVNTHFYVSSGAGGWGPPVRLGSPSEIINLKVIFEN